MGRTQPRTWRRSALPWKLRKRWIRQPLSGIGLRVCDLAVCIELRLQGFLGLLAIWPVARALGPEGYGRAGGTAGFDGDVRKPFGNVDRRFLHETWVSTSTESIPSVERYSATSTRVPATAEAPAPSGNKVRD